MYQRLYEGFRMLAPSHREARQSPGKMPAEKDLESQAWRWLLDNRKLGVGDLIRQGRWGDALLFLNFVTSSYRFLKRNSLFPMNEHISASSVSTPRGKQEIIETMIAAQLNIYDGIHPDEFFNLPIEECENPLLVAMRIIEAATGTTSAHVPRERKVKAMSSCDAWDLLQSLLKRINGTRGSIRRIRDWAYRLSSVERRTLLLCAADFKGRIRRSTVPVIITIFYTTVKCALKLPESMAWSTLQAILPRMSGALRNQMCAYIYDYRKLGYFHVYNLGPTQCCLNDKYLKVCNDLLNDFPQFLWSNLYQSLTEKYKVCLERRRHFISKPQSDSTHVYIFDNRESDYSSLSIGDRTVFVR